MKYFLWLFKAAIFFTLFAFALNNQQDATVHFFFGFDWRAPLVLVVLAAFAVGLVTGMLVMVPRWWKHRKAARRAEALRVQSKPAPEAASAAASAASPLPSAAVEMPPFHGI